MNIIISSRRDVYNHIATENLRHVAGDKGTNLVVISILDRKDNELFKFNSKELEVDIPLLTLRFDDANSGDYIMTKEDANEIWKFMNSESLVSNIETLIVHCAGGISRSAGVAAALSKIYNNDDMWVFKSNLYVPNTHVYNLVLSAFYENS